MIGDPGANNDPEDLGLAAVTIVSAQDEIEISRDSDGALRIWQRNYPDEDQIYIRPENIGKVIAALRELRPRRSTGSHRA